MTWMGVLNTHNISIRFDLLFLVILCKQFPLIPV